MFRESPPRGYMGQEFPLQHNSEFSFDLTAEGATQASTIVPILISDQAHTNADTTIVNPRHASYAVVDSATCYPESIIPRIQLSYRCSLTKGAIETDAIRSLSLNIMPIYTAFLNRLDATDTRTGQDTETILELTHETTDEQCYPLWGGTKLANGSTLPSNIPGLTTNQIIENVVFDKEGFFDAMQYYTNKNMLKTMVGRMRTVLLKRDYPYSHSSNNFNYPITKFMNPYAFCGILFHLPQTGQIDQYGLAADTTAISHVHISGKIRFPEWNKSFNQESA